jgi:hypothetical protein
MFKLCCYVILSNESLNFIYCYLQTVQIYTEFINDYNNHDKKNIDVSLKGLIKFLSLMPWLIKDTYHSYYGILLRYRMIQLSIFIIYYVKTEWLTMFYYIYRLFLCHTGHKVSCSSFDLPIPILYFNPHWISRSWYISVFSLYT